ncbi:hypothetical protein [Shinella sp. HZN7]|uniref:hypothetical protein n=1 Tax=Shinella sp. (strain HZN7) TaxID=879274 RepID=UPI0007DA776B|nr:hypothetical protein [Shinella sp. HZN7]ANH05025.1 hypothetical protein shn_13895 [Shinella sp. HZN7]
MTEALARLGATFAALMVDYRAAQSQLAALQHEADRTAADAGLVYGSSAWSAHRFAVTGRTVHHVNALYEKLEDLAQAIAPMRPTCFADLLIKARAHQFSGNPAAIIPEIEALALASNQEAA